MTEMARQARRLILDQIAELQIVEETIRADGELELAADIRAVANATLNAARVRGLIPRE